MKKFLGVTAVAAVSASSEGMHFLALGDWGGKDSIPFKTYSQVASAEGMSLIAKEQKSQFILALGDNMYYSGIDEDSDENDARFQQTFEEVYTQPELQIPWYVIAGNHDWKGNVQAQIDYSTVSERWNFPDYNHEHTFSWTEDDKNLQVQIILIDTPQLSGVGPDVSPDHPRYFDKPTGPLNATLASDTYAWIEEKMQSSTADYIWVAGHYPVYSACPHGNTDTLLDNLKPLLDQYEGHYMAGHDHCQMHIKDDTKGTNYLVTGSGEFVTYEMDKDNEVPSGWLKYILSTDNNPTHAQSGFSSFSATSEKMTVTIHDQKGDGLYSFDIPPRSEAVKQPKKN